MIRFQRLPNVSLTGGTSVPTIPRTPEGIAMGAVPGWILLADPAHVNIANGTVRNRAMRDNHLSGSNVAVDTLDGLPVFAPATGDTMRLISSDVTINPNAWSVFAVARPATSSSYQHIVHTDLEIPAGQLAPQIGFSTVGNVASVRDGSENRISYQGDFDGRDGMSLVMWTGSTRDGLRIFDNGALVAAESADKRPFTVGYGPGEWGCFRFTRGHFGMLGMLNIDLGWPEHAGYRRSIEGFLMDRYGID